MVRKFDKEQWINKKYSSFKNITLNEFRKLKIKPQITLLTVNDIEREAVLKEMANIPGIHCKYSIYHKTQTYYIGRFGSYIAVMVQSSMGTSGPTSATLTTQETLSIWRTPVIVAVGVAMGLKPGNQKPGDVLISKTIQNYNVNKITNKGIIDRSARPLASSILVNRFTNCMEWKYNDSEGNPCKIHSGLIITGGSLVNDPSFTQNLKKNYKDAIGNEMEASGIWSASEKSEFMVHWIIVKGICDWGYEKKDDLQPLAASAAVSLCKTVFSNDTTLEGIVKVQAQSAKKLTRINSLKFYYLRTKYGFSTQHIAAKTGIDEVRIKELESFKYDSFPFDNGAFPVCTNDEIKKIERIINYGRRLLEVKDEPADFMGYLLSFYFKNKLKRPFKQIKAVVFDFDGTLTKSYDKTTTWQRIWVKLGYDVRECNKLHEEFSAKQFDHQKWCDITCEYFRSRGMTKTILNDVASEISLIEGSIPTLKKLNDEGIHLFIASGSIRDVIYDVLGSDNISLFEEIQANRMEFDRNGKLRKIIGTKYDFEGKCTFIEHVAYQLNCNPYEILFVGNSNNDEVAFSSGAVTLCVNPDQTNQYKTNIWNNLISDMHNLKEILNFIDLP